MSFIFYDLAFLIIFAVFFSIFLYKGKKNIKKERIIILYRTKWGVKLIDKIGKGFPRSLKFLSYVSVGVGYVLMISMFYLLWNIMKVYLFSPDIVRVIKVPPITPLIPYLPQVFKLDFLPPFYFTYWIVIIAIIAITHEVAHGIFMRRYGIKIKSTGFAFFPSFFPIFPAAFVEQDEKSMSKSSKFEQLSVLSAGTFANILTAVLFFGVWVLFIMTALTPAGIIYDTYPYEVVSPSDISAINGIPVEGFSYSEIVDLSFNDSLNSLTAGGRSYVASKAFLEEQKERNSVLLYYDAPAVRNELDNVILEINGNRITSISGLESELSKYSPNETVSIKTLDENEETVEKEIVLEEHPEDENKSWLGVGFSQPQSRGGLGSVYQKITSFRDANTYYEQKMGDFGVFVYNLLWWIILISISVALVNMLPVGIFDGGRFFYLTVLAITKNERVAKKAFAFSTYAILLMVLVLMIFWVFSFR